MNVFVVFEGLPQTGIAAVVSEDAEFASNPAARLDFFYRRHASWDERYNLYPVYRVGAAP